MARRERTTALPRRRERTHVRHGRTFAGITWDERNIRWLILGAASVLLLLVVGVLGYNFYRERWLRPNEVVLQVGSQDVKLSYYADRLPGWFEQNASGGLSQSLLEQQLLNKLEDEELTVLMAEDRGISISSDDIDSAIAGDLGVPVGGDGSSFDNLYRQQLKTLNMSNSNYRRLVRAQVADRLIKEQLAKDIGDTGELITLRTVVLNSEERAKEIAGRINGGEDMGAIAQTESLDLQSRTSDGVMQPEPAALIPEAIRKAVEGKGEGILVEPVLVENNWWVLRVEKRDPAGTLTAGQKDQLAQAEFTKVLEEKRSKTKRERSLDPGDIRWAIEHAF